MLAGYNKEYNKESQMQNMSKYFVEKKQNLPKKKQSFISEINNITNCISNVCHLFMSKDAKTNRT